LVSAHAKTNLVEEGQTGAEIDFWLPLSGRSDRILRCESCRTQWDINPSGDLTLYKVHEDPYGIAKRYKTLSPGEWARVAWGLNLDAGNFACDRCGADYFIENDNLTLVDAAVDHFGFVAHYQGRRLSLERVPWIAVGKSSGVPGPACEQCRTEFDREGEYLRLRFTPNSALAVYTDEAWPFEDWHRIARSLPTRDQEANYVDEFYETLRKAILFGDISPSKAHGVRWESPAEWVSDAGTSIAKGRLRLDGTDLEFKCRRNPFRAPLDAIIEATAEGDDLTLRLKGKTDPVLLRIEPVTLRLDMDSGRAEVTLGAGDCAEVIGILRSEVAGTKTPASE